MDTMTLAEIAKKYPYHAWLIEQMEAVTEDEMRLADEIDLKPAGGGERVAGQATAETRKLHALYIRYLCMATLLNDEVEGKAMVPLHIVEELNNSKRTADFLEAQRNASYYHTYAMWLGPAHSPRLRSGYVVTYVPYAQSPLSTAAGKSASK